MALQEESEHFIAFSDTNRHRPDRFLTCQVVILLIFFILINSLDAQSQMPENVLFIGNSYTFHWNLPQTVAAMAAEKNIKLSTRQSTAGGAHWGHHWRSERKLNSLDLIISGEFEAVVLRNKSMSTLNRADSMDYFGGLLDDLIPQEVVYPIDMAGFIVLLNFPFFSTPIEQILESYLKTSYH